MLSPPPPASVRTEVAEILIDRSADTKATPRERIRAALAATQAGGALPQETRCRAHLAAGELLLDFAVEPAQVVSHLRSALGLCADDAPVASAVRLAAWCTATRACPV